VIVKHMRHSGFIFTRLAHLAASWSAFLHVIVGAYLTSMYLAHFPGFTWIGLDCDSLGELLVRSVARADRLRRLRPM